MNYTKATARSINGLIVRAEYEGIQPKIGQIFFLEEDKEVRLELVGVQKSDVLVLLNLSEYNIKQNEQFYSRGESLLLPVGEQVMGRVFNSFGQVIDGGAPLKNPDYIPVEDDTNSHYRPSTTNSIIETGIKVIDFFAPFVRGRKVGFVGGAGVG